MILPVENDTSTCSHTFTSPLSFNHYNLYGLECLSVGNCSFSTNKALETLVQPTINNQTTNLIINMTTSMENVPILLLNGILLHLGTQNTPCHQRLPFNRVFFFIFQFILKLFMIPGCRNMPLFLRKYSSHHLFILFNPILHVIHLNLQSCQVLLHGL